MNDSAYEPVDRRPIKSRDTRWAASIAKWMADRGVSPNGISIMGMLAAIGAGLAFAFTAEVAGAGFRGLWILGGVLCQVRLLCNLFDGMVAIQRDVASPKGELYNEVPDRVSDAAVMIGLGYACGDLALGLGAALAAVFVAYVRAMGKSIGTPNDFCGPMAKPQRMALVTVLAVYLAVIPESWRWSFGEVRAVLILIILGCVVTAARRLYRAGKHLEGAAS